MNTELTLYAVSAETDVSTRYRLAVAGRECPVIKSPCYQVHYAMFDLDGGPVELELTAVDEDYWAGGVQIHPLSRGIAPVIEGRTLRFRIDGPCQLSIERAFITGEDNHAEVMVVYANPPERNPCDPDDPNVLYFGPGVHRLEENIELRSGQTLYLAGGAIVWADGIRATDAGNLAATMPPTRSATCSATRCVRARASAGSSSASPPPPMVRSASTTMTGRPSRRGPGSTMHGTSGCARCTMPEKIVS